jgi:hypothetical protein
MKNQPTSLVIIGTALGMALAVILVAGGWNAVHSESLQTGIPTPAPTPTPGEPVLEWPTPSSPLFGPILTAAQALTMARTYDVFWSVWDKPWNEDTLESEPGRITIESFPSRTAESTDAGRNEGFAPEIDAEAGAVWRITIKGGVMVNVISRQNGARNTQYDGVTYVISQKTGSLLAVITGEPKR